MYSKLPPLLNSHQQAGASSLAIKAALLLPSRALSGAKISNWSSQISAFLSLPHSFISFKEVCLHLHASLSATAVPHLPIPLHCNENPIYVFLFWELRGLSPCFHIQVSVSDLYIPRIGPHISCSRIRADRSWEYINCSQTHECGNWDCGRALCTFLGIFVSSFRYWFLCTTGWLFSIHVGLFLKSMLPDGCNLETIIL